MVATADEIVRTALRHVEGLAPGIEFELSTLFARDAWKATPKKARLDAGVAFRAEMEASVIVACLGRDARNHQRYRRL